MLRPLKVTKTGRTAENANGEEQHQQPVADGLHPAVDIYDGLPDGAALEGLRRFRQQRPHLRHFVIPCRKCVGQVFRDPIIVHVSTSY